MTTWTLTNDLITSLNGSAANPGYFGDLAPAGLASGDTIICGDDTITGAGYIAGDLGQGQTIGFNTGVTVIGGNDLITGSGNVDIINGGGGNDTMDGGAGFDYAEMFEVFTNPPANARVIVDLEAGTSRSDYYGNDTLLNIEGVIGSFGNDYLAGSQGANELFGSDGNDNIDGRGGNDKIAGGNGDDTMNGGDGSDTLDGGTGYDYAKFYDITSSPSQSSRVVVDLQMGKSWSDAFGNDTSTNIEGVLGSYGGDWIAGDTAANEIYGLYGDDVIFGRDGNDTLHGDEGNDALYGGDGDDLIGDVLFTPDRFSFATRGNNWMSGGDGNDTILAEGAERGEWSALHGDAGNDTISGSGDGSLGLYGGDGADSIRFGRGVCYIEGGAGADVIGPSALAFTDAASFAQVFDFEDGTDKISLAAIPGASAANVDIRDWGANTGILMTNANGVTTTLMLMGVTSDKISFAGDFVLV